MMRAKTERSIAPHEARPNPVQEAVYEMLVTRGTMIRTDELLRAVQARGFEIKGKDVRRAFAANLAHDKRVECIGANTWALREWQVLRREKEAAAPILAKPDRPVTGSRLRQKRYRQVWEDE